VDRRAGLNGCGKSFPNRDSISGPSSPQRFVISTELSRPIKMRRLQAVNVKAHTAEMLMKHCHIDQFDCRLCTDPATAHTSGKYRGILH